MPEIEKPKDMPTKFFEFIKNLNIGDADDLWNYIDSGKDLEIINVLERHTKNKKSWLQYHLDSFVRPVLGSIPNKESLTPFLNTDEMTVIKNCWRSVKKAARKQPILLAGRDVWIYEVLARRENYPTVFLPECSRLTVGRINIPRLNEFTLLDTGFAGSIPRTLGINKFYLMSYVIRDSLKQIFPKRTGSRGLALKLEYLPKYWKAGHIKKDKVCQEFSDLDEFYKCAVLTQQIYTDSSPKWTNKKTGVTKWR